MKKIIIIVAVILLFVPALTSAEGIANNFSVDHVRVDSDGRGYVSFTSALTNTPASCTASGYEKTLAFNTTTAGGKAIYSMALTAKATGKKIYAKGAGSCGVYSVMEDWVWGRIID